MKLKLSLRSDHREAVDVIVTADATATVGDIARFLRASDPGASESTRASSEAVTIRAVFPGVARARTLNPLGLVHDSGLRSGCTVELVDPADPRVDSDVVGPPVAVVEILDGPDAGRTATLVAGANYLGRDELCQVVLSDERVSRVHALVTVTDRLVVTDLNSANGTASVPGEAQGLVVTLGSTTLAIRLLGAAVAPPAPDATFQRSPRVEETYRGESLKTPDLPQKPEKGKFPIVAMIAPLAVGAVMFSVTKSPLSLVFIAVSPLIMLGTYIDSLITNRRRLKQAKERFEVDIADLREQLTEERRTEQLTRQAESPQTEAVVAAIHDREGVLWTRRPEHATFLEVRLGTGTQPSRNTFETDSLTLGEPDYRKRVKALVDEFGTVDDVPVLENLDDSGALGIAGDSHWADSIARALMLQLAGLHSPADLVITALATADDRLAWDWLKWLPHVGSAYSPLDCEHLADDARSAEQLVSRLEELVDQRRRSSGRHTRVRSRLDDDYSVDSVHGEAVADIPPLPVVVLLVTEGSPVERSRLVSLAEDGPDFGVHIIWRSPTVEQLPAVCRTFVRPDGVSGRGEAGFVRRGTAATLERLELADALVAGNAARALSSVTDDGARVLDESDLPRQVGFLDLFGPEIVASGEAVTARWHRNGSLVAEWRPGEIREPGTLRAVVGQGPVDALALDLRMHGPHALVGGTTGAGKSEFLQTWIMAMAAEHSPDRLTFLLVDYKGGAAFSDCVALPHTVGLVTDLTPHLVRRALTSLRAELRYREELLNRKGAKDLIALERQGDPEAPPSLVIVVDEFAALVGEVPEFVDGVVDVAQRGRSLGLHLVLATQRPAGIIKDNLRANTNLRVALRMADEADSTDVLGVKDAALFDPGTPGRGAAKLGPGRLVDFQTAYVGGRADATVRNRDVEAQELVFGAGVPWFAPQPQEVSAPRDRDITRLVHSISAAATGARVASPRKPWLDELPDVVDLSLLDQRHDRELLLGIVDEPEHQRQSPFSLDLDTEGNVAVFGTGGSGKSALLRTIAVAASRSATVDPVRIYGIDFAGGGLSAIESLPTVGAIVAGDDRERLVRLLRDLAGLVAERASRYAEARASSISEFRSRTASPTEERVIVLVEGMAAFRAEYEFKSGQSIFETFAALVASGRQVGVHFVMSADRLGAFPSALLANIQSRVVFRLANASEYSFVNVSPDALQDAPAGRAVIDGHDVQIAVPGRSSDLTAQVAVIEGLATGLRTRGIEQAPGVARLSAFVSLSDLPNSVEGRPTIGIGDESLDAVGIPLDGMFVVTGPFGSGRTTAMRTAIDSVTRVKPSWSTYLLAGRRAALAEAAPWTATGIGADASADLANRLADEFEAETQTTDEGRLMVVIENVGDFEGLFAESAVARLVKAARRAGHFVLVEGDTVTASSAWQLFSELKSARAGIVLQPEESDGLALFRTQFPRVSRSDFPVGRGMMVVSGRASRVQVAVSSGVPEAVSAG